MSIRADALSDTTTTLRGEDLLAVCLHKAVLIAAAASGMLSAGRRAEEDFEALGHAASELADFLRIALDECAGSKEAA